MLRLYKGSLIYLRFFQIKPRLQNTKKNANWDNIVSELAFLFGGAAGSALYRCPVAVPEKMFGLSLSSIFLTAATRSPPSPCHRQRSARSPNSNRIRVRRSSAPKTKTPRMRCLCFWCRWPDSNRHAIASGGF